MGRMLSIGALMLALPASAQADVKCLPERKPKGTVLLLHGGGFVRGSAEGMSEGCRMLARRGWRALSLEYPLGAYRPALRYAIRATRRYRGRVVAVGQSAGGGLALHLAQKALVRRAVGLSATMPGWPRGISYPVRVPLFRHTHRSAPTLVLSDPADPWASWAEAVRYVRRTPRTRLKAVRGGPMRPHVIDESAWVPRASSFLER